MQLNAINVRQLLSVLYLLNGLSVGVWVCRRDRISIFVFQCNVNGSALTLVWNASVCYGNMVRYFMLILWSIDGFNRVIHGLFVVIFSYLNTDNYFNLLHTNAFIRCSVVGRLPAIQAQSTFYAFIPLWNRVDGTKTNKKTTINRNYVN